MRRLTETTKMLDRSSAFAAEVIEPLGATTPKGSGRGLSWGCCRIVLNPVGERMLDAAVQP